MNRRWKKNMAAMLAAGRKRKPVREYLEKQGRFAHFTEEDIEFFQRKTDEMWEKWLIPGVIPFTPEAQTALRLATQ